MTIATQVDRLLLAAAVTSIGYASSEVNVRPTWVHVVAHWWHSLVVALLIDSLVQMRVPAPMQWNAHYFIPCPVRKDRQLQL